MSATYYTLKEAAVRQRVSVDTIRRAIYTGTLAAKKTHANRGARYLVSEADLDAWFDQLPAA